MGIVYEEIRGVMTQFEPLTEQALSKCGVEGLTLEALNAALIQAGLSPEYVVHDPTRKLQNTFYADYEKGLYCEIYLQQSNLDKLLRIGLMNYREKNGRCLYLENKDWKQFYYMCVPVPMSIFDFQRRYKDIPPDEVFGVWHEIYRRIDFSNGMWAEDVLEYVLNHAPPPCLPDCGEDGYITVYRGMGELSAPAEKAISWST